MSIEMFVKDIENIIKGKLLFLKILEYGEEQFLESLFQPFRPCPIDRLNQLQNSEIGSYDHFAQECSKTVIHVDMIEELKQFREV